MENKNYVAPSVLTRTYIEFETAVSSISPERHVLVDPSGDDHWVRKNGAWEFTDPSHDDYWNWG